MHCSLSCSDLGLTCVTAPLCDGTECVHMFGCQDVWYLLACGPGVNFDTSMAFGLTFQVRSSAWVQMKCFCILAALRLRYICSPGVLNSTLNNRRHHWHSSQPVHVILRTCMCHMAFSGHQSSSRQYQYRAGCSALHSISLAIEKNMHSNNTARRQRDVLRNERMPEATWRLCNFGRWGASIYVITRGSEEA